MCLAIPVTSMCSLIIPSSAFISIAILTHQEVVANVIPTLKLIRWRTFFFLNPDISSEKKKTFGFNSSRSPPKIPELNQFEDGLLNMIQNIEFKNKTSAFQHKLSKDVKDINKDNLLLIPADKTTNFYKVKPEQYDTLPEDNITKDYKNAPETLEDQHRRQRHSYRSQTRRQDKYHSEKPSLHHPKGPQTQLPKQTLLQTDKPYQIRNRKSQ